MREKHDHCQSGKWSTNHILAVRWDWTDSLWSKFVSLNLNEGVGWIFGENFSIPQSKFVMAWRILFPCALWKVAMLLTDMIVVICRCPSLEKNYPLSKYFMNRHSGFTKRRLKGIKQYEQKTPLHFRFFTSEAPAGRPIIACSRQLKLNKIWARIEKLSKSI